VTQAPSRNPLTIPLIAVSAVAALEAVLLTVLLLRDRPPATAATSASSAPPVPAITEEGASPAAPQTAPTPAPEAQKQEAAAARGKVGERVESAGFAITVEKLVAEPQTYKDQVTIGPDQRYLALLVRVDNNTGGNAQLFPSQFTLKDDQGFPYQQLGIHGTMPALEWRTLANRETVRGYADFVVPKSARGLMLLYSDTSYAKGAQPIHIGLDQ
jgi:hypothetical protein